MGREKDCGGRKDKLGGNQAGLKQKFRDQAKGSLEQSLSNTQVLDVCRKEQWTFELVDFGKLNSCIHRENS